MIIARLRALLIAPFSGIRSRAFLSSSSVIESLPFYKNTGGKSPGFVMVMGFQFDQIGALNASEMLTPTFQHTGVTWNSCRLWKTGNALECLIDFTVGASNIQYATTLIKVDIGLGNGNGINSYGGMGIRNRTDNIMYPEYTLLKCPQNSSEATIEISGALAANKRYQAIGHFSIIH